MHKKLRKVKVINGIWISSVLIIVSLFAVSTISAQNKIVYLIDIKEDINQSVSSYIDQSLRDAGAAGADAVILEINTFGGWLDAGVEVRDNILNSEIQTIAFINKRAISAGALISLAADKIIMAPGATIGAATPVNFLGEKASEKVISYWRAEMRATAEKNNRPVQIADAMVDEDVEIPGLIEKGKLLTLTTEEALKYEIADYQAEDITEVLKKTGMAGARIIQGPPKTDIMDEWLKPELIWFIIGLILIILEFLIPGLITIFFGIGAWIVSVICLFLDISLNLQLSIFLISSVLLLVSLRKWFKTLFTRKPGTGRAEDEVADEFVGQKAVVTEKITPNRKGRVEFRGSYWTAESYETIPEGASVEILDKDNITLIVKSL
jgi:membrane-bound serine protease (ClpP class)